MIIVYEISPEGTTTAKTNKHHRHQQQPATNKQTDNRKNKYNNKTANTLKAESGGHIKSESKNVSRQSSVFVTLLGPWSPSRKALSAIGTLISSFSFKQAL